MFPDTANFSDPAYTGSGDIISAIGADPTSSSDTNPVPGTDIWGVPDWSGIAPSTGGDSVNTPAQGSSTGSGLLGWLGLGTAVAQAVTSGNRTGYTTRPGVNRKPTSLGSFGTLTTGTLLVIVLVFVGAVWLLSKK